MIKVMLDEGALIPEKAHKEDAGFDLRTPSFVIVPPNGYAVVDTGVHIEIPMGCVGMIKTKSGINMHRSCITEGVIDSGYTGSIVVKIYNLGNKEQLFMRGDKITQLVVMPIVTEHEVILVEEFEETERGNGGFGSTGR